MKQWVLILSLVLSFLCPVYGQAPTEYLAIYCSGDRAHRYQKDIFNHHIDAFCEAKDWRSLAPFLRKVKQEAAGRPIVLNLMAHGMDVCPVLVVSADDKFKTPSYTATMAGVINTIEEELSGAQLVTVFETCFGSTVYKGSINPGKDLLNPGNKKCLLQARTKGDPDFICYGMEDFSNPVPCALEQYLHKDFQTLVDLRKSKGGRLSPEMQELYKILNYVILERLERQDGLAPEVLIKKK